MLNPFPHLLLTGGSYAFFIPTLLRITASLTFVYVLGYFWNEKAKLMGLRVPIVGALREWMFWVSMILGAVVAACLFVGYETQIAAILGMLMVLKHMWAHRFMGQYLPLSRIACVLLFVICLSLLFSGAGAVALDLPL